VTLEAGAWRDAEAAVEHVLPYVGEVHSGRSIRLLRDAVVRIETNGAPGRLADAGHHLGDVLAAADGPP
jgi:hypothetical protein